MKTSIFILFVGLFSYGYCQSDPCDPLAANIAKKPEHLTKGDDTRSGDDFNNQYIDMGDYLASSDNVEFVIARASHRDDLGESDVCTSVSFGKGCGPITYTRRITAKPDPVNGNYFGVELKGKVKMELKVWTLNLLTLKPVGITQTATLVDGDDFIFQVDSNKFYDLTTGNEINSNLVSTKVKDALLSKFAMNHIIIDEHEGKKEVKAVISITCDQKYGWATYTKKTVDDNHEGKYALIIEEKLKHLDTDHRDAGKNEYDVEKVKPLSTVYPKQYRDKQL